MANQHAIPIYRLYGENAHWPLPDMLHCESIATRSKLHDWNIKLHRHAGLLQLLYLQSGRAVLHLDERRDIMSGGQVLLVPQGCVHGFQFEENAVGTVLTLTYPLASRLLKPVDGGLLGRVSRAELISLADADENRLLETAFAAIVAEYQRQGHYRNALLETLLAAVLICISRGALPSSPPQEHAGRGGRHFAHFSELLDAWFDKHYPVTRYAQELGITAAHLNLVCRRAADRSAQELIHERLALEAKRSLAYTAMSVAEVAYASGFSDPAYFTRFFKRLAGCTPREFRLRMAMPHGGDGAA